MLPVNGLTAHASNMCLMGLYLPLVIANSKSWAVEFLSHIICSDSSESSLICRCYRNVLRGEVWRPVLIVAVIFHRLTNLLSYLLITGDVGMSTFQNINFLFKFVVRENKLLSCETVRIHKDPIGFFLNC